MKRLNRASDSRPHMSAPYSLTPSSPAVWKSRLCVSMAISLPPCVWKLEVGYDSSIPVLTLPGNHLSHNLKWSHRLPAEPLQSRNGMTGFRVCLCPHSCSFLPRTSLFGWIVCLGSVSGEFSVSIINPTAEGWVSQELNIDIDMNVKYLHSKHFRLRRNSLTVTNKWKPYIKLHIQIE